MLKKGHNTFLINKVTISVMHYTTAPYYFLSFVLPPRSAPLSSHNSPHSLIHYLQYPTRFFTPLSYGPHYRTPPSSLTRPLTHPLFVKVSEEIFHISTSNQADLHPTIVQGETCLLPPSYGFYSVSILYNITLNGNHVAGCCI